MDAILEKSYQIKQALVDFVLEAEGELATALEVYAAEQSRRKLGDKQHDLIVDTFTTANKPAKLRCQLINNARSLFVNSG